MQQSDTEIFLSTPSARRATCALLLKRPVTFISIHALREEGDIASFHSVHDVGISIHALREEGDISHKDDLVNRDISIHALREEGDHVLAGSFPQEAVISIHALREEGDVTLHQHLVILKANFYPRPPRGGRP